MDGYQSVEESDDYGVQLLNILPGELLKNLGIKLTDSGEELDKLNQAKE